MPASQIGPALFDDAYWRRHDAVIGAAPGRGTSLFVQAGSQQWVLRHYHRGGLIGRIIRDRYLWIGEQRTRAFRELRLTAALHARGLPVPPPVAACVWRSGLSYRAALITRRLKGTQALAERLPAADTSLLERVGACVADFHAAGLDHVDLNARNLLVDGQGGVWLIDFDRCRLRRPGRWQAANLDRLARSLAKFDAPASAMEAIRRGYRAWSEETTRAG